MLCQGILKKDARKKTLRNSRSTGDQNGEGGELETKAKVAGQNYTDSEARRRTQHKLRPETEKGIAHKQKMPVKAKIKRGGNIGPAGWSVKLPNTRQGKK